MFNDCWCELCNYYGDNVSDSIFFEVCERERERERERVT